jgi:glutathione synthase
MRLGLLRSDYLLHTAGNRLSLKQVQFSTVSLSFDPLSERATNMHMCLRVITTSVLAEGLAEAHDAYGVCESVMSRV